MLEAIKFALFVFVFLFLPGRLVLSFVKNDFSKIENFIISTALGIALLTFFAYLFGFLSLSFLVYPLLLLADFYLIFFKKWRPSFTPVLPKDYLPIAVVLVGAVFQGALLFKSGTSYQGGLAFWGVHGYDAVWHLALIRELVSHFPPQNPGFAGELLKNYHFLTDLFLAQTHKITGISILNLYFRFAPLLWTLLLNSLIYFFVKRWLGKISVACWAVFFTSIAGSFGWVPQLFGKGSNNWETAFWGIQPTSAFLNPPFGLSLVLLMLGLILLDLYLKERTKALAILVAFAFGILIGFKVYAGIIVLGGLGVLGGLRALKGEKNLFLIFLLSGFLALGIYLPFASGSTNFLVWQPWWFIKTMIEAPDRLNWSSLELRRQVYVQYHDFISLFLLQAFAFLIFLFGNLGTRFLGFLSLVKRLLRGHIMDGFVLLLLIFAFLPPIFFIQKAVHWNSIQFFYYFTFLFSFFAAEGVVLILSKLRFSARGGPALGWKILKIFFLLLVIGAALPSTLKTIYWFNAPTPTTLLVKEEIEALRFLGQNSKPEEITLTYPFHYAVARAFKEPPVPMTYYNSPYVSFFAGRRVYLEDQNAATLLGYEIDFRLSQEREFFSTRNTSWAKNFLEENKINYLYLVDNQDLNAGKEELGLEEVFNNQKVRIYKVGGRI